MIIKRLELENFLSYAKARVDFPRGSIAVIGENGAGKSSLLDAVLFALYRDGGRGSLAALIRQGTSHATVRLEFEVRGRRYLVERRIVRKAGGRAVSDAKLYEIDGRPRLIAYSPSTVDNELKRILGMDKHMFLTAVYIRQGEVARLLEVDPSERKRVVAKLLGIEELEKAYANFVHVINALESRLREEKIKLAGLDKLVKELEYKRKKIKEIKIKITKLEKIIKNSSNRLKEVHDELEDVEKTLNELTRDKEEYIKLKERAIRLKQQVSDLKEKIDKIELAEKEIEKWETLAKLKPLTEEYSELLNAIKPLEERLRMIKSELEDAERKVKNLPSLLSMERRYKRLKDLAKKLSELRFKLSSLELRLDDASRGLERYLRVLEEVAGRRIDVNEAVASIASIRVELEREREIIKSRLEALALQEAFLKAAVRQRAAWVEQLEETKGKCPLCGAYLPESKRQELLSIYTTELREFNAKLESIPSKKKELENKLKELDRRLRTLSKIDPELIKKYLDQLRELENELKKTKHCFNEIASQLKELGVPKPEPEIVEKQLETLEMSLIELGRARGSAERLPILKREAETLEKEINILRKRMDSLARRLEEFGNPSEVIAMVNEAKGRVIELKRLIEGKEKLLEGMRKAEEELHHTMAKLAELEERVSKLELYRKKRDELLNEYMNLSSLIDSSKRELMIMYKQIKELMKEEEEILAEIKRLNEIENKVKNLEAFVEILKKIRQMLGKDGLQKELRLKAKPVVEKYLRMFAQLFGLPFLDVRLSDDYDVMVIDGEGARSIDSVSGGEKVVLALALRLALAKALSGGKARTMLLDEPTIHLDEIRRRSLVKAVRRLFGERGDEFPQLVLVTHERELEDAADVVMVVRRTASGSKVELAEGSSVKVEMV